MTFGAKGNEGYFYRIYRIRHDSKPKWGQQSKLNMWSSCTNFRFREHDTFALRDREDQSVGQDLHAGQDVDKNAGV